MSRRERRIWWRTTHGWAYSDGGPAATATLREDIDVMCFEFYTCCDVIVFTINQVPKQFVQKEILWHCVSKIAVCAGETSTLIRICIYVMLSCLSSKLAQNLFDLNLWKKLFLLVPSILPNLCQTVYGIMRT